MRLAILISLCVLIVVFSAGSFLTYEKWRRHRYDRLIEDAVEDYKRPGSPFEEEELRALLKAIMDARGHFNYYTVTEDGEGLLQVPDEGVRLYKEVVKDDADYDFGYVCINKAHRPHRDIKYDVRGVCNICKSPLIPGLWYPKDNVEIGTWYLAKLADDVTDAQEGTETNVRDVIPLVVAAYCLTERRVRQDTDDYRNPRLPPRLRASIRDILQKYDRYRRKGLK